MILQEKAPWLKRKKIEPKDLEKKAHMLRREGKKIATLNGSFDLLHAGHLYMIHQASLQADILIVLLNTDRSIQEYKGKDRPFIPLEERLQMMAALEFVDYVSFFDETDPREALIKICPDVHVNGQEYTENCIEKEAVEKCRARLHLVDRIPGLSTTEIMKKIQTCV